MRCSILAALFLLMTTPTGCSTPEEVERRHEREKELDAYYEMEWVKCVNDLGVERCKVIQETGMWKCRGFRAHEVESGIKYCAKDRFEDRHELLEEERQAKEEQDKDREELREVLEGTEREALDHVLEKP